MDLTSLVDDLMIARGQTRNGRPVRLGNDTSIMPGPEDIYQSYGIAWANLSNTSFRLYKHWIHEGGISTPLIAHWPKVIAQGGGLRHTPGQLPDLMATIIKISGATYPETYRGNDILLLEGTSLVSTFARDREREAPLFWEHEGNAAVRVGNWKLVRKYPDPWELYDMEAHRTEMPDLSADYPKRVAELHSLYEEWAHRCGVIPREVVLESMKKLGGTAFWEKEENG